MVPDRAAGHYPPLPARFKTGTREARTLVDDDDAPTPDKAVRSSESSDLSHLSVQLQALTIAVRDLRDEIRRSRSAGAHRASGPTTARAQAASRNIGAKITNGVLRLVLMLAIAAAVAAALMLFIAGPAFGSDGVLCAGDRSLFPLA